MEAILWPMLAQVALVAVVTVRLYQSRIGEIRRRGIDPQSLATSGQRRNALEDVAAADNFRNLFEVPVLFFAVCLALAVSGLVSSVQVALAWLFLGLRALHSLIHLTYNRVTHRFLVYLASTLCVFVMWVLLGVALWREG